MNSHDPDGQQRTQAELDTREPDPHFLQELKTVAWLQYQVRLGKPLPVTEAEAVAHSLYVALDTYGPDRMPQLPLRRMAEYVAVHAVNVALLAMALAEYTGLAEGDVRELGLAGLLHDIGMALVPVELLAKSDQLEQSERDAIKQHPLEGARLLVQADASLELAAVVAYEHHIRMDGSGYPQLTYPRKGHYASRLVQVCDVYHALHSPRPFRQPWPQEIIFSFINERAGFEFDPELAHALTEMLSRRTIA